MGSTIDGRPAVFRLLTQADMVRMASFVDVRLIERAVRPTGEPPRCTVCSAKCEQSLHGPALCGKHKPRQQGTAMGQVPAARREAGEKSRQAIWKAAQRAKERAERERTPAASIAGETAPKNVPWVAPSGTAGEAYRRRLIDRLEARGLT